MPSEEADLLWDYHTNRRSLQAVVQACRSYAGPAPHFLWSPAGTTPRYRTVAHLAFDRMGEAKLFDLLAALIGDDPSLFTITHDDNSFLSVALERWSGRVGCSTRILLLLAVPGVTRRTDPMRHPPLHEACGSSTIGPDVIYRLINLDPDVLTLPGPGLCVPLHGALVCNPRKPFVRRMVEVRPESLLCRNRSGETPIEYAFQHAASLDHAVSVLLDLIVLQPGSLVLAAGMTTSSGPSTSTWQPYPTPLMRACSHLQRHSRLLEAMIHAYPPALCVAATENALKREYGPAWRVCRDEPSAGSRLPFEGSADYLPPYPPPPPPPAFVATETLHMTLAVIEYVLSTSDSTLATEDDATNTAAPAAVSEFRRHVKDTLATFLPNMDLDGTTSGFVIARAVSKLPNRMDVCKSLFHPENVCCSLRNNDAFREAVLGRTTVDLYRMNRQGRLDGDGDENDTSTWSTADHHVDLLELVNDNVECIYLHVRDNWARLLPPTATWKDRGLAGWLQWMRAFFVG